MKFDTPATTNPIDQLKVIGQPTDRIDGPLKTTGSARYAYEQHEAAPDAIYGVVVGATIAKGRITAMDLSAARAAPGVRAIVTAQNAGKLDKGQFNTARLLAGPGVEHYHQAVALVVGQPQRARQPETRIAGEQPVLHGGPDGQRQPDGAEQQGNDQRKLTAGAQPAHHAAGQQPPQEDAGRADQRQERQHHDHRHQILLDD